MTAPNHAAGGLFFSSLMCSFWNINIFASPIFFGVCVFCSILPDADTGRTLIGRALYPIARLIERNFGHRTLTHSLFFILFAVLVLVLVRQVFGLNKAFILIVFFSLLSHSLLDMLTIQGVPLFWPLWRNPCVLPANHKYRLKTGEVRTETIVFVCIVLLCFSLYPLFKNGFWTSYNRFFATLEHVEREDKNSVTYTIADYCFIKNGDTIKGSGYAVEAKKHELTVFDTKKITKICADSSISVVYAKPRHSVVLKVTTQKNFFNITSDSLHKILSNRIISGIIQSSKNVQFTDDKNITYHTNFIKLKHVYNFHVAIVEDSAADALRDRKAKILAQLLRDSLDVIRFNNEYNKLIAKRLNLTYQLSSAPDNYTKNNLQNDIITVSAEIKAFKEKDYIPNIVLLTELGLINELLKEDKSLMFSGFVSYPEFNKKLKNKNNE